jgi:hypothetical protein
MLRVGSKVKINPDIEFSIEDYPDQEESIQFLKRMGYIGEVTDIDYDFNFPIEVSFSNDTDVRYVLLDDAYSFLEPELIVVEE